MIKAGDTYYIVSSNDICKAVCEQLLEMEIHGVKD